MSRGRSGIRRHWPWITVFVALPATGAASLYTADFSVDATGGLLAGIGVLGGLLFQVLAWVSGRIAALADGMGQRKASPYELALVRRLDIARANIAYASFVSIAFVTGLGVASMLTEIPEWASLLFTFALLHLGVTLVLVLLRINQLGKSDRITALTAHARDAGSET